MLNVYPIPAFTDNYYKMGAWDGRLSNGAQAPLGVYVYLIEYQKLVEKEIETIVGTVTLIR